VKQGSTPQIKETKPPQKALTPPAKDLLKSVVTEVPTGKAKAPVQKPKCKMGELCGNRSKKHLQEMSHDVLEAKVQSSVRFTPTEQLDLTKGYVGIWNPTRSGAEDCLGQCSFVRLEKDVSPVLIINTHYFTQQGGTIAIGSLPYIDEKTKKLVASEDKLILY